jgi:glutathione peroxidase
MKSEIYSFKAKTIEGKEVSLEDYQGKVLLIVNTASKCGFTPHFEGLQKLYQKYQDKNFVILGFPCNQFAHQDPGTDKEILEFCQVNYGVSFPMFSKIDVNGPNTHPLFVYLKKNLHSIFGSRIKWNFTKFLIDRNGNPVKRFSPSTQPLKIENDILKLIG